MQVRAGRREGTPMNALIGKIQSLVCGPAGTGTTHGRASARSCSACCCWWEESCCRCSRPCRRAVKRAAAKREDLAWMRVNAPEIQGAGAALLNDTGEAPVVIVDRVGREAGLGSALRGTQPSGNGVRVQLEAAPFDTLVTWLATLDQRYGLAIESITRRSRRPTGCGECQHHLRRAAALSASPAPRTAAPPLWPTSSPSSALAALAVVISALPASIVTHFLPPSVHAEDFSGSVWHGSAGRITVAARDCRRARVAFASRRLAALESCRRIALGERRRSCSMAPPRSTAARLPRPDLEGGGPIEDLRDLGLAPGWRGSAKIQVEELKAGRFRRPAPSLQRRGRHDQRVESSSTQVAGGADLGGYLLRFADPAITPDSEATAGLSGHRRTARRGCDDSVLDEGAQRHALGHHQGARRMRRRRCALSWTISRSCARGMRRDAFRWISNSHFSKCDTDHCFATRCG